MCVNNLPKVVSEAKRPVLEPATYWLQVRCPNHYATMPHGLVVCLALINFWALNIRYLRARSCEASLLIDDCTQDWKSSVNCCWQSLNGAERFSTLIVIFSTCTLRAKRRPTSLMHRNGISRDLRDQTENVTIEVGKHAHLLLLLLLLLFFHPR